MYVSAPIQGLYVRACDPPLTACPPSPFVLPALRRRGQDLATITRDRPVNISKPEQRVLHALALGGRIVVNRADNGRVTEATCFTREGFGLEACTLPVFRKLREKRLIESRSGAPYRISHQGRRRVAARPDNRG